MSCKGMGKSGEEASVMQEVERGASHSQEGKEQGGGKEEGKEKAVLRNMSPLAGFSYSSLFLPDPFQFRRKCTH